MAQPPSRTVKSLVSGTKLSTFETSVSRLPFVALSDSLLADFRPSWAHTNSVIGPLIRQRNRISRQRGGNVVLAGLLDGGQVRSYDQKS